MPNNNDHTWLGSSAKLVGGHDLGSLQRRACFVACYFIRELANCLPVRMARDADETGWSPLQSNVIVALQRDGRARVPAAPLDHLIADKCRRTLR